LRSGLRELSNPQRSRTDRAIHRRGNRGVGQFKCHLLFDCSGAIQLRHSLGSFDGENVDLPLGRERPDFPCCNCAIFSRNAASVCCAR
jgi:hypothetical protein